MKSIIDKEPDEFMLYFFRKQSFAGGIIIFIFYLQISRKLLWNTGEVREN